mmetsp:Transcript_47486/g.81054  ORF Transcript_47486/g.81054 Transcript_47486/m.81054 type:complete len:332 (-) Transcript_47486:44-1039(-)
MYYMATEASMSARVHPIRIATANPCIISSEQGPMQCSPTTLSSSPASTSLSPVVTLASSALKANCMEANEVCFARTFSEPNCFTASGSVKPMVPMGGWLKTTVAMLSYSILALGSPPNKRSASLRPAAMATGVNSHPVVVASPIANTLFFALVFSNSSTTMNPLLSTATLAAERLRDFVAGVLPMADSTTSNPSKVVVAPPALSFVVAAHVNDSTPAPPPEAEAAAAGALSAGATRMSVAATMEANASEVTPKQARLPSRANHFCACLLRTRRRRTSQPLNTRCRSVEASNRTANGAANLAEAEAETVVVLVTITWFGSLANRCTNLASSV